MPEEEATYFAEGVNEALRGKAGGSLLNLDATLITAVFRPLRDDYDQKEDGFESGSAQLRRFNAQAAQPPGSTKRPLSNLSRDVQLGQPGVTVRLLAAVPVGKAYVVPPAHGWWVATLYYYLAVPPASSAISALLWPSWLWVCRSDTNLDRTRQVPLGL
jgi:hypothetical protein